VRIADLEVRSSSAAKAMERGKVVSTNITNGGWRLSVSKCGV
jgi:hypothetical protein